MGAPTPTLIPAPFASSASGPNINFPIPPTPPGSPDNAASWSEGFPAVTMQEKVAGGQPPLGQDFNGILLTITEAIYALQAGQQYGWDSSFSGVISGYNVGAQLAMSDGSGFWLNTTGANATNPDDDGTAEGWIASFNYGIASLAGLTGNTVTLTPSQWRRPVIELSGTLTSNLTVVLPPNVSQQWLVVNNTNGSFTTTVKTPAGTGVVVPQAGPTAPTGVWCDGTNIYQTQAPLSASISQSATPLSIVQRDNLGQGFFTRLNQSSALENPTIGSVAVQSTSADGYYRWISLANFKLQMFASPALTGTPTAPTAASNTRTTQIATTAFANPAATIGAQGSQTLPSGLILKWGSLTKQASVQGTVVTFPAAFPNNCFNVQLTSDGGISFNSSAWNQVLGPISKTNFQVNSDDFGTGSPDPTVTVYWFAIGN